MYVTKQNDEAKGQGTLCSAPFTVLRFKVTSEGRDFHIANHNLPIGTII